MLVFPVKESAKTLFFYQRTIKCNHYWVKQPQEILGRVLPLLWTYPAFSAVSNESDRTFNWLRCLKFKFEQWKRQPNFQNTISRTINKMAYRSPYSFNPVWKYRHSDNIYQIHFSTIFVDFYKKCSSIEVHENDPSDVHFFSFTSKKKRKIHIYSKIKSFGISLIISQVFLLLPPSRHRGDTAVQWAKCKWTHEAGSWARMLSRWRDCFSSSRETLPVIFRFSQQNSSRSWIFSSRDVSARRVLGILQPLWHFAFVKNNPHRDAWWTLIRFVTV